MKTLAVNIQKMRPPVTFSFFCNKGCPLKVYVSDSCTNKQPGPKLYSFKLKNLYEFIYPRGYEPVDKNVQRLPKNTIIYISLESSDLCNVGLGLQQFSEAPSLLNSAQYAEEETTVEDILKMPNIKFNERLKKIKTKVQAMVKDEDSAIKFMQAVNIRNTKALPQLKS